MLFSFIIWKAYVSWYQIASKTGGAYEFSLQIILSSDQNWIVEFSVYCRYNKKQLLAYDLFVTKSKHDKKNI